MSQCLVISFRFVFWLSLSSPSPLSHLVKCPFRLVIFFSHISHVYSCLSFVQCRSHLMCLRRIAVFQCSFAMFTYCFHSGQTIELPIWFSIARSYCFLSASCDGSFITCSGRQFFFSFFFMSAALRVLFLLFSLSVFICVSFCFYVASRICRVPVFFHTHPALHIETNKMAAKIEWMNCVARCENQLN